jgi:hypothetical protein
MATLHDAIRSGLQVFDIFRGRSITAQKSDGENQDKDQDAEQAEFEHRSSEDARLLWTML